MSTFFFPGLAAVFWDVGDPPAHLFISWSKALT